MNKQINIIIVDDHQIVIDGLKVLLLKDKNIKVIGEANSSDQLFDLLPEWQHDVYVVKEAAKQFGVNQQIPQH